MVCDISLETQANWCAGNCPGLPWNSGWQRESNCDPWSNCPVLYHLLWPPVTSSWPLFSVVGDTAAVNTVSSVAMVSWSLCLSLSLSLCSFHHSLPPATFIFRGFFFPTCHPRPLIVVYWHLPASQNGYILRYPLIRDSSVNLHSRWTSAVSELLEWELMCLVLSPESCLWQNWRGVWDRSYMGTSPWWPWNRTRCSSHPPSTSISPGASLTWVSG